MDLRNNPCRQSWSKSKRLQKILRNFSTSIFRNSFADFSKKSFRNSTRNTFWNSSWNYSRNSRDFFSNSHSDQSTNLTSFFLRDTQIDSPRTCSRKSFTTVLRTWNKYFYRDFPTILCRTFIVIIPPIFSNISSRDLPKKIPTAIIPKSSIKCFCMGFEEISLAFPEKNHYFLQESSSYYFRKSFRYIQDSLH